MVAYLLGEGLSSAEVSRALRIERSEAQETIGTVLRKLKLRSSGEVADLLEDRREGSAPISLAVKP
jgi:DNA-binding CsgD family transcriptional regulator